jgi:lipopolysaccharide export system permease protein
VVVLLSIPGHLYEILPVAVLIGTLFTLSRLVANSEYAVMRVSGLSNWRVAGYFAVIGVLLSLLVLLLGEYVAPWSEQAAQRYKLSATRSVVAQQFRSGLWVKDGTSFINVREVMPDNTLSGIEIYGFDADGRLNSIRAAEKANWRGSQTWNLQRVMETHFDADGIRATRSERQDWRSVLTPDILSVLLVAPEQMSARTLWRYVAHLKENNQKATRYELALWSKFISPLVIPIMMLIAMPFAIQGPRGGGTSSKIFIGILAGLGFHLLSRLFGHLGLLNDWPVVAVSILPLLIFLGIALAGIRWVERR